MTRAGAGQGKLILFGEHAAVYGYPAAGTSLPCGTELTLSPGNGSEKHLTPDETGSDRDVFIGLLENAERLTGNQGLFDRSVWRRKSTVPRSGGFGSSAALCVAISRIVLNRPEGNYNREVHRLANRLEKQFHGTPSGIDTGMAADNGCALWLKSEDELPERRPLVLPDWNLIYGALPRTGSTGESVGHLRDAVKSGDRDVIDAIEELGRITAEFVESASGRSTSADPGQFSRRASGLADRAQGVLASLGLSTPELDILLQLARETGAVGGKMSGGGMGGAFYLCAPDETSRNRIMETLPGRLAGRGIKLTVPLTPFNPSSG